jgi:hypothetical protein
MDTIRSIHVPFRRLPIECKVLFLFLCVTDMPRYRGRHPSTAEVFFELGEAWNFLKFAPEDFKDPDRMLELVRPYWRRLTRVLNVS